PGVLRCGCGAPGAFEPPEPLGEQGAGEPGSTLQDRPEGLAAEMQVADDQRRPTLGEDLRAAGDRAVLTVGPHECSVAECPARRKSRFRTSESRSLTSRRCRPVVR